MKAFEFERVYNPTDTQDTVFDDVAPLLTSLLDGYVVVVVTNSSNLKTQIIKISTRYFLDAFHIN